MIVIAIENNKINNIVGYKIIQKSAKSKNIKKLLIIKKLVKADIWNNLLFYILKLVVYFLWKIILINIFSLLLRLLSTI